MVTLQRRPPGHRPSVPQGEPSDEACPIRQDARGKSTLAPTDAAPMAAATAAHYKEAGILTDAEWARVRGLSPEQRPGEGPPRRDERQVLCAILWVMDTGASERELPQEEFGPNSTAYGRYRKWLKEGLWSRIVQALGR